MFLPYRSFEPFIDCGHSHTYRHHPEIDSIIEANKRMDILPEKPITNLKPKNIARCNAHSNDTPFHGAYLFSFLDIACFCYEKKRARLRSMDYYEICCWSCIGRCVWLCKVLLCIHRKFHKYLRDVPELNFCYQHTERTTIPFCQNHSNTINYGMSGVVLLRCCCKVNCR